MFALVGMENLLKLVGAVLSCLLLTGASWGAGPKPEIRTIPLTRAVRIPVITLNAQGSAGPTGQVDRALSVTPGAPDELPEGPDGFDVLNDGSFLITDPLRDRLAVYDSRGSFIREWKLGFAADSVTVTPGGLVLIREATTGETRAFDREGQPVSMEPPAVAPQPAQARLLTANSGEIFLPAVKGGHGGPLEVRLDRLGFRLLSLEALSTDAEGNTYVALEATAGGETVDVNKYVRRYNAQGALIGEIADMKVDYYIRPVDELRVRRGVVYQLMTTPSAILINEWDTN